MVLVVECGERTTVEVYMKMMFIMSKLRAPGGDSTATWTDRGTKGEE
jgi:hypothetical protein